LIENNHKYRDVISYTPRQIKAFCELLVDHKKKENATALYISVIAQSGNRKSINEAMKDWTGT
jgi:hypothetical protein